MLVVGCFPMNLILRPIYLHYRLISGLRHWVRRRFTPPGLAVISAMKRSRRKM